MSRQPTSPIKSLSLVALFLALSLGTAVATFAGQGNSAGTSRLGSAERPPVSATLRWKYGKDPDVYFCPQIAIPWYAGYNGVITDMRLRLHYRYYEFGAHLNEEQTAYFGIPSMIVLKEDDGSFYYLNADNGKVYSEEFLYGGYRGHLYDACAMINSSPRNGDEIGTVSGWGDSTDVYKYFDEHGAINDEGKAATFMLTHRSDLRLKFATTQGRPVGYIESIATEFDPRVRIEVVDGTTNCVAPIEISHFANLADGERAVFGVSDATMANAMASVPEDERKICLRFEGRGITAAEAIYNARAEFYLAWEEDGAHRTLELTTENPWPSIEGITVAQPDAGVAAVDFSFGITNSPALWCHEWNQPFLSIIATDNVTGSNYVAAATALSGDTGLAEGEHTVTWDMAAQGLDFLLSSNVTFKVSYINMPECCVVDLSGGADAASYPVTYLDERPLEGWTDEYRADRLAMRLLEPGTFTMGGDGSSSASNPPHEVALTQPFYCAVFETTQRQWELATGDNPSRFKNALDSSLRPVERVSCNAVSGATSFLSALRSRSGLSAIDLPTEAQWEYACRAGTSSRFAYGDAADGDYMWYSGNSGGKTHEVGSNQPNGWGLYDMHGNVREMCRDTWADALSPSCATNPVGSAANANIVVRGGGFNSGADGCASSFRSGASPSDASDGTGFRLVRTIGGDVASECVGECFAAKPKAGVICSAFIGLVTEPLVVSNVAARQRWPWNGLVDVDYDIGGFKTWFEPEVSVAGRGEGGALRNWIATNFLAGTEPRLNQGRNRATWDTKADGVTNVLATAVATVSLVKLDTSESVTLRIANAYRMDVEEVTAEVTYDFGDIDRTDVVEEVPFDKSRGSCSVKLEVPFGAKVRSVVLQVDDVPFEWLDYAEPVAFVGGELLLDASANEFANGAYAAGTVMLVANPRQLDNVRRHLDGSFRQVKDIDFAGSCGITNVIDVAYTESGMEHTCSWGDQYATARFRNGAGEVYGWTPIGTEAAPFRGVYDGGGFRISRAVCNSASEEGPPAGLFGFVEGSGGKPATIRGVRTDFRCFFSAQNHCGGIAGRAAGAAVIYGCESAAEVFAYCGGGILGAAIYGSNDVTIAKCVSGGLVYGNRPGGIVSLFGSGTVTLDRCVFRGDLHADCMAGGIVQYCGWLDSDKVIVRDCAVEGYIEIHAHEETEGSGGLVGVMNKKTVFEGTNKVRCEMSYNEGVRMVGGAVGGSSFSVEQTREALGPHVEVARETIHDASSENNVGRYCGSPWIDEL